MSSLLSISPCITAQATAVWLSKEIPEDERYKTSELLGELSLKLHDYIHHKTGADHRIHYYHSVVAGVSFSPPRSVNLPLCLFGSGKR